MLHGMLALTCPLMGTLQRLRASLCGRGPLQWLIPLLLLIFSCQLLVLNTKREILTENAKYICRYRVMFES